MENRTHDAIPGTIFRHPERMIRDVVDILNNAEEFGNDDADTVHDLRMLFGLGPSEWIGRDPFRNVRVGDPDPTPDGAADCGAMGGGYACTLYADHGPTHVAVGEVVIHVWRDR